MLERGEKNWKSIKFKHLHKSNVGKIKIHQKKERSNEKDFSLWEKWERKNISNIEKKNCEKGRKVFW